MRRLISVQPDDHLRLLIEEQQRRCELHTQGTAEGLLGHLAAVDPCHFPVAPQVEGHGDQVATGLVRDARFGECGLHQQLAVRTAILAEVDHQPLPVPRGVRDVFAKVEKRVGEPFRRFNDSRCRLAQSRRAKRKQHSGEHQIPFRQRSHRISRSRPPTIDLRPAVDGRRSPCPYDWRQPYSAMRLALRRRRHQRCGDG